MYQYDWSVVPASFGFMLQGLAVTLQIAVLSFACSLAGGLVLAGARMAPFPPLNLLAFGWTQVFRALSLLVYILWVYFGLAALFGINLSTLQAAVICLTLLNSAFMSEIYRSSIAAVDRGQHEAALSLGFSKPAAFASIILPQALIIAVPGLMNQMVGIIQETAIVAAIGGGDLLNATISQVANTSRGFELYTTAGLMYLTIVLGTAQLVRLLEKRLRRI
jgi:His/Glu/Gln/Arg/opine family amino acid ABC transporter permease subunit